MSCVLTRDIIRYLFHNFVDDDTLKRCWWVPELRFALVDSKGYLLPKPLEKKLQCFNNDCELVSPNFYFCMTCKNESGWWLIVCESCVQCCHQGHDVYESDMLYPERCVCYMEKDDLNETFIERHVPSP